MKKNLSVDIRNKKGINLKESTGRESRRRQGSMLGWARPNHLLYPRAAFLHSICTIPLRLASSLAASKPIPALEPVTSSTLPGHCPKKGVSTSAAERS